MEEDSSFDREWTRIHANRRTAEQNAWRDRFAAVPFEDRGGYFQGRYYQDIAIEQVLEYVFTPDDLLIEGDLAVGERFVESDFNKKIEIKEREAHRVKIFMDQIDQREKTLVFSANQDHALMIRDLINQMKTSTIRITVSESQPTTGNAAKSTCVNSRTTKKQSPRS